MSGAGGFMSLPNHVQTHYVNNFGQLTNLGLDFEDFVALYQLPPSGKHYVLTNRVIGRGTFGIVMIAIERPDPATVLHVAVKVLKRAKVANYTDPITPPFRHECNVFERLADRPHPNVITCLDSFHDPQSASSYREFVVLEYSQFGDLKRAVHQLNANNQMVWMALQERYCRPLIRGIAEGVRHLHQNGIAHGDIKMDNVLIFFANNMPARIDRNRGNERFLYMVPKLTDFSSSTVVPIGDPITCDHERCSIGTAAPETWHNGNQVYDMKAADVYSVGSLCLALLLGCSPFEPLLKFYVPTGEQMQWTATTLSASGATSVPTTELIVLTLREGSLLPKLIQQFDPQLRQFLLNVLQVVPQNRPTIEVFLTDEWFTNPDNP